MTCMSLSATSQSPTAIGVSSSSRVLWVGAEGYPNAPESRPSKLPVPVRPLLDGVRVLDLGIWRPVPYATQLLVEMGADVLKVEPPGGDPMRVFPQLFRILNAGRRSIVVDLKTTMLRLPALRMRK